MTLTEARTQAREFGRADSTGVSDARLNALIDKAIDEFSNDVGGFDLHAYPAISATFSTATHFAIRVTIVGGTSAMVATDVVITGTAQDNTTGTIVASDFQATLRTATGASTVTVVWANFAFTVDTVDGTSITFEAPTTATYANACGLLGLSGTTTEAGADVTGDFPTDCTIRYTLPSGMISVQRVEWDGDELTPASQEFAQSPQSSGTPNEYYIRDRTLYFNPSPSQQGLCEIWYRGIPTALDYTGYQECGLTTRTDATATGLTGSTQYYFKVAIDGGAVTEYDITTASDVTYAAVIILMNAEVTGATFSLEDGDLRCSSASVTGTSTIALSAGTTGTNLFATLTGWAAFESAVVGDTALPSEIPANYHGGLVFLLAYYLLLMQFEDKLAGLRRAEYSKTMRSFRLERHSRNTEIDRNQGGRSLGYTVTM